MHKKFYRFQKSAKIWALSSLARRLPAPATADYAVDTSQCGIELCHGLSHVLAIVPKPNPEGGQVNRCQALHPEVAAQLSVANSYSRGDREHDKAAAVLFPSEIAQRGRMRDHTAAHFRRRVSV